MEQFFAIEDNRFDIVSLIVDLQKDKAQFINRFKDDLNLLGLAQGLGHELMVDYLLKNGADYTPLLDLNNPNLNLAGFDLN